MSEKDNLLEIKINKADLLGIINEWDLIDVNDIIKNFNDEMSIIDLFELFDLITEKSQFWISDEIKSEDLLSLFDNVLSKFGFYEMSQS